MQVWEFIDESKSTNRDEIVVSNKATSSVENDRTDKESSFSGNFVLEKGEYKFTPKYSSWDKIPKLQKIIYSCFWEQFAKCARCIIGEYLQMKFNNSIHHETLGCCNPTAFYLALIGSQGCYRSWFQDVLWNGIKKRQTCIQFRFYNSLPNFDKYDDWGNFTVRHTHNTSKFGQKILRHKMQIVYLSMTCNIETNKVWCSFRFQKTITHN